MPDPFEDWDRVWGNLPASFAPAMDIYEDENNVFVESSLPGIDPKDVEISVENDILTIEGRTEKKSEVDEKNYYRKEVRAGSFHRSVALPKAVKGEDAKAEYENGMLKITIPKEERAKPKTIKVEVKNKK